MLVPYVAQAFTYRQPPLEEDNLRLEVVHYVGFGCK